MEKKNGEGFNKGFLCHNKRGAILKTLAKRCVLVDEPQDRSQIRTHLEDGKLLIDMNQTGLDMNPLLDS